MPTSTATSTFQDVLESVESLPLDDQEAIIEVVQKRVTAQKCAELIQRVREAQASFAAGEIWRGDAADLIAMLGE